jgi:hypothetical protein
MVEQSSSNWSSWASYYTDSWKESRKKLSDEEKIALYDILDEIIKYPDANSGRIEMMTDDNCKRIYKHPLPEIQITYEINPEHGRLTFLHVISNRVQVPKLLFISYSHIDHKWLEEINKFLKPLERKGVIKIWNDQDMKSGTKWRDEIQHSLEIAQVAVLLVTQAFIASDFIRNKEIPELFRKARQNRCQIFWIPVSFSTVSDTEIEGYLAACDPNHPLDSLPKSKRDKVLTEIYNKIKTALDQ